MSNFTPGRIKSSKPTYTSKQKKLMATIWEHDGDALQAAKAAGFKDPHGAVKRLSDELIEIANKAMVRLSVKSVKTLEKILDSSDKENLVIQGNEKLKACQLILDRTNPKTEKVDVTATHKGGVFILPEKRPVDDSDDDED